MKRQRGAAPEPGCLRAWAAESEALAGRWRAARRAGPRGAEAAARQQRGAFGELLLRMRGLPAALPTLPLELTVLYNSLLFVLGTSDRVIEGEAEGIRQGLLRVLEACGSSGQDLSTEELWQKVLLEVTDETLWAPLHRLGALQAAWWLAASRLRSVAGLFQLLSSAEALEKKPLSAASSSPYFLIRTELLVHTPIHTSLLRHRQPSEVKYLLAQRCLQEGRVADAVEHYLDFLAVLQEGLQQQVPLDGGSALPRIPEAFLEAASALQQDGRHRDAITVCEEVISRTNDLIPRMLEVEEGLEQPESPSPGTGLAGGLLSQKRESLHCLTWRAAAYLHQGWAWVKLGENKEAVTQFSRCLSELLRFPLCGPGAEPTGNLLAEVEVLQKIRLLSLIGRGTQFLELGKHKEALLDFHYGLQVSPGDPAAASYLVQALWKLNRKQEAAAQWQKHLARPMGEDGQQEGQGRPFPLYLVSCVKQAAFPQRESLASSIQDYLRTTSHDPFS
ncbi:Fanconi anemia group G protein isoform 4-T4 [Mergus octosetaceus]